MICLHRMRTTKAAGGEPYKEKETTGKSKMNR